MSAIPSSSSSSSSSVTISALDNNTVLPAFLFKLKKEVACTLFVQDAKIDYNRLKAGQAEAMYTCEFGLGALSRWGQSAWGEGESRPLNRAVKLLNDRNIRLWLMAKPEVLEDNRQKEGASSFMDKFQKALAKSPLNILEIKSAFKQTFPTPFNRAGFDSKDLSTYYSVGYTPYRDLPPEHFANISEEYPKNPRIAMMDGGVTGSVNRIFGYKFLSRLAMNGTEAAAQNPSYVIIESIYRPDLAGFLKTRFPKEERLVLKHAAASRGEGVVVINASDEKTLDADLKVLLAEGCEFKKVSSLSICLVEKFISAKEKIQDAESGETITRVVYLALQSKGEFELHVVDGVKSIEDPSAHETAHTKGLVKLSKWHNGNVTVLNDETIQLVQQQAVKAISAIAKRAIQYDQNAALTYFLKSDNHILNLVGVELLTPTFVCDYRSRYGKNKEQLRLSNEQCDLLIDLLKRNQRPILLNRIFANCISDIPQLFKGIQYATKFGDLVKKFWDVSCEKGLKSSYEDTLKTYFAIFTKDHPFRIEHLIHILQSNAE